VLACATPGLAQQKPAPATMQAQEKMASPSKDAPKEAFDPKVARRITPDEVKKRMDAGEKVVFIDTRGSFSGPIVKGAHHVPSNKLDEWSKEIAKDMLIVAYCT
jgi:hypothetical protein